MFKWIKRKLLNWLLKNTWHSCAHDFECKMATTNQDKKNWAEYECKKCYVCATTQFNKQMIILVSPETNAPFIFEPWALNRKKTCFGITKIKA